MEWASREVKYNPCQTIMRRNKWEIRGLAALSALLLAITLCAGLPPAAAQGSRAYVLTLDGPLTPAQAAYLERALNQAQGPASEVIILQLNTPGGDIGIMQKMVSLIRSSQVPVVVFVSPRGALAGSAGTVVTLAGDAAAMAPETVIGAASPVGSQGQN